MITYIYVSLIIIIYVYTGHNFLIGALVHGLHTPAPSMSLYSYSNQLYHNIMQEAFGTNTLFSIIINMHPHPCQHSLFKMIRICSFFLLFLVHDYTL